MASAYFSLGCTLPGWGVEHCWPFGHRTAEGFDLVRGILPGSGLGVQDTRVFIRCVTVTGVVQDWPGPAVPQLGFLSAWARGL